MNKMSQSLVMSDEWKHETSGSNKQDLKVSAFIQKKPDIKKKNEEKNKREKDRNTKRHKRYINIMMTGFCSTI